MKWQKLLALGMAAIMTAAFVTGCGGGADKTNNADKTKKIVVGLDDNFPPMGFKNESNEIVGFDIDLAKEASKRLGREVEFTGRVRKRSSRAAAWISFGMVSILPKSARKTCCSRTRTWITARLSS